MILRASQPASEGQLGYIPPFLNGKIVISSRGWFDAVFDSETFLDSCSPLCWGEYLSLCSAPCALQFVDSWEDKF